MRLHRYLVALSAALGFATTVFAGDTDYLGPDPVPNVAIRYLAFPSSQGGQAITIAGRFQAAANRFGPGPVVIIMHGTGGVSPRGIYYATALNRAGIATFEIDQWGGRGLAGGPEGRPKTVPETLPDVFGAMDLLARMPEIDAKRIGIMGFSWGGVVAMLASTERYQQVYGHPNGPRIAASMPLYPVCWVYGHVPGYEVESLHDTPLRIVAGGADDYDDGSEPCRALVERLVPSSVRGSVSLKVYEGAGHAFDGFSPTEAHPDAYGHRGKGGAVMIGPPDPVARDAARGDAVRFFVEALKP